MHMENMVLGIAFGTVVTSFLNSFIHGYKGTYNHIKLSDIENDKPKTFPVMSNRFAQVCSENFFKIPGNPVAYWVTESFLTTFETGELLGNIASPKTGMTTGDNNRFLRFWFEVDKNTFYLHAHNASEAKASGRKWFPYCKGGGYRRYYGYNEYLVNWQNDGYEIKNNVKENGLKAASVRSEAMYFKKLITWSAVTSGSFSCRMNEDGALFDSGGSSIETNNNTEYILAVLNSKLGQYYLDVTNSTINYQPGDIARIPIIFEDTKNETIICIVSNCIQLSKTDWDSFETSWDFKEHPFVKWSKELKDATAIGATMQHYYGDQPKASCPLELCYLLWQGECNDRRAKLKSNEEELNRIFIEIYGLQDELTPEVEDKDITVRAADLQRDMRSFVSYAVGCMFGRYSLDVDGLAYAGGEWDESKYKTFKPDVENCLPVTEEYFFEDDIVTQFANFVSVVFGADTLEENLSFIAENIGIKGNGTAREKIRQYFLKEFYKDHCKVYQKRPIYWMFDTGKKNGFKALCYLHRWDVNTVGNVRIDYMHKLQKLYRNELIRLQENIDNGEEIAKNQKRLEKITNQLQETEEYDAKIGMVVAARTEIDLDDGVKVNYDKVQLGSDGKKYQILATI
ncbi:MAG: BREX-1 system adenine-specific DNA-methyltransferase PglX, partial [Oscillospiraceae bacterium]|nr:BREX-1 system adenine-specific DNA-methyltransferase PglX [Oscillospiraceae bacterium]